METNKNADTQNLSIEKVGDNIKIVSLVGDKYLGIFTRILDEGKSGLNSGKWGNSIEREMKERFLSGYMDTINSTIQKIVELNSVPCTE